jgi:hypothetical protein
MRLLIFLNLFFGYCQNSSAQKIKWLDPKEIKTAFPKAWIGVWKGTLNWQTIKSDTVKKFTMELRIIPTEKDSVVNWIIIYGDNNTDNRPYKCKLIDKATNHWVVDENNGILIDQFIIGKNILSSFSVENVTITNSHKLIDNKTMEVSFITTQKEAITTSGNNTEAVPEVKAYKVLSIQIGKLYKVR